MLQTLIEGKLVPQLFGGEFKAVYSIALVHHLSLLLSVLVIIFAFFFKNFMKMLKYVCGSVM